MKDTLEEMGMEKAFNDDSNFSGMGSKDIFLQAVIHKTFIAVDEDGTEAAGTTSVVGGTRGQPDLPPRQVTFQVDRPFLFLIFDNVSRSILFVGRITNPLE